MRPFHEMQRTKMISILSFSKLFKDYSKVLKETGKTSESNQIGHENSP